jgi:hypothetical protein
MAERHLPLDLRVRNQALAAFLATTGTEGRSIGTARCGIYAFFDFDGEPIYVGQTTERVSTRVRRHLTNQRTDAVAMHVLDPLEVAELEVWPFWQFQGINARTEVNAWKEAKRVMNDAESAVYQKVLADSPIGKVLNEVEPPAGRPVVLPASSRGSLIPDDLRERLGHPDDRIARRAQTISNLSLVAKERDVSLGLRRTLATQAERLQRLAEARYRQVRGDLPDEEVRRETVGHEDEGDEAGGT